MSITSSYFNFIVMTIGTDFIAGAHLMFLTREKPNCFHLLYFQGMFPGMWNKLQWLIPLAFYSIISLQQNVLYLQSFLTYNFFIWLKLDFCLKMLTSLLHSSKQVANLCHHGPIPTRTWARSIIIPYCTILITFIPGFLQSQH